MASYLIDIQFNRLHTQIYKAYYFNAKKSFRVKERFKQIKTTPKT